MSKKTIKRIISLSLAASSLLGGAYQLGIDGNSKYVSSINAEAIAEECDCKSNSDYCVNCFIEKMTELSVLAKDYMDNSWKGDKWNSKNYTNGRYDLWFTFAYIRRIVYSSDSNITKWGRAAGGVNYTNFKGFTDYIKEKSPELYGFTSSINSKTSFHINNTEEKFEIAHMCATVSAYLYTGATASKSWTDGNYINQVCGWAGDYQTLMNSAYKATYIDKKYDDIGVAFGNLMGKSYFSCSDLFADVASYEIGKIVNANADIDIETLLKSCFNLSEPKGYIARFCKSISIKEVMKYTKPGGLASQLKYSFTDKERCKMANAFSNYLKENFGSSIGFAVDIEEQPIDVSVEFGKKFSTTVIATGDGLTYQWYFKEYGEPEDAKFKKSSIITADYTTVMNKERSGRQVYCIITDKYGNSVQTDTVTLKSKVAITKDLVDVTAKFGEQVNFSVSATGHGLTYEWHYKNKNMKAFDVTNTFKTNTYSFDKITEARAGREVYCVITDIFGNSVQTKTIKIDLPTGYGDADCDGKVTDADVAAIQKAICNPDKYGLSVQGEKNADVSGGDGVTLSDALLIQQYLSN